jgi:hypothetical protein
MNVPFIRSGSRTGGAGVDAEGILGYPEGILDYGNGIFSYRNGIFGYLVARVRIWVTMAVLASA